MAKSKNPCSMKELSMNSAPHKSFLGLTDALPIILPRGLLIFLLPEEVRKVVLMRNVISLSNVSWTPN
ncbi:hypothetical protein [Massilia frigida]|uniref:hypothetical protein n=1 Tax=Massilia frigida TaxID=2609281 RepID=UPI00141DAADC|nr:hypothetical protein [Massilia frigida]